MTVEVQQTVQDYLRAQRLHFRPRPLIRGVFWALGTITLIAVADEIYIISHGGVLARGWWLVPLAIAYGAFLFLIYLPWRIARIFRDNPNLARPTQTTLDSAGLILGTSRGGVRMPWSMIKGWKANRNVLLIYQSRVNFSTYPRHSFASDADYATWLEALQKNVGPGFP